MSTTTHITTAAQLLAAGDIGRCELIRGEVVFMSPSGSEHGRLAGRIGGALAVHVAQHRLGEVLVADAGFILSHDPDTVVAPDAAFVARSRVPGIKDDYFDGAPDLAVEIISPSDRATEVSQKVQDYLDAGCRIVWLVNPRTKSISVHRRGSKQVTILTADDTLTGDDVVPGFSLPLSQVFNR